MKFSIERKIMIPFLLVVLSLTVTIAAVAYWGEYKSYVNYRIAEADRLLLKVERLMEGGNSSVGPETVSGLLGDDIVLLEQGRFVRLPQSLQPYGEQIMDLSRLMPGDGYTIKNEILYGNDRLFSQTLWLAASYSRQHDRMLAIPVIIEPFPETILNFQKYILLVGLLAGMLAIEITIFLSYHITLPIKKLAAVCQGPVPGQETSELPVGRNDEIGILASSFSKMMVRVEDNLNEIRRMQQFNDAIFSSISTGIITVSYDGRSVLKVNPTATKILKMNEAEIVDKWQKNNQQTLSLLKRLCLESPLKNGGPAPWEHNVKEGDENLCLSGRTELVYDSEGNILAIMLLFEDITDRRSFERNMERVKQLASFGEIAASLAHEIRNPLAGIKTCSQVLADRLPPDTRTDQLVTAISTEIDRINGLITNMLSLARPLEPKRAGVSLNDSLSSITGLILRVLRESRLALENRLPGDLPELYVDPDHLKQILLNLVLNAIKASPAGSAIKVSLHSRSASHLSFVISDEGKGISPDNLEKVFQPFFSTYPDGSGLGLAVVQKLLNENGGEIDIMSDIGKGTHMIVKLPVKMEA
ncbi:MAG: ATP-binding protein [Bacillota bacterium]